MTTQTVLNDLGLGSLTLGLSNEPLDFQPFEVSHCSLGIIARTGIKPGDVLTLSSINGPIELEVVTTSTKGVPREQERYALSLVKLDSCNLESLFAQSGCYERIAQLKAIGDMAGFNQFRNARFTKGPPMTVVAQTFGTLYKYRFRTKDVSRSGMLLLSERDVLVPFIVNTLLEVTIDPDGDWLKSSLSCMAKVVRRGTDIDPLTKIRRPIFGVHFIEFGDDTHRMWRSILEVADQVQTKVTRLAS